MKATTIGVVADRLGQASYVYCRQPRTLRRYISAPSISYRTSQIHAPVHIDHRGSPLGRVEHLELDDAQRLLAVAVIDAERIDLDGEWWFSPSVREDVDGTGARDLLELTLTRRPASIGLPAVQFVPGDVCARLALDRVTAQAPDMRTADLLRRAHVQHRAGGSRPFLIVENRSTAPPSYPAQRESYERRPTLPRIEHGPLSPILAVSR